MAQNAGWRRILTGLLLLSVALLALNAFLLLALVERAPQSASRVKAADTDHSDASGQRQIYVPAYSHIYQDGLPILMEVALSLRNTDPTSSITVERIDYFDNEGKLLRRFLTEPLTLGPLVSVERLVERADFVGGMGANFLVSWSAAGNPSQPFAEAIMAGGEEDRWAAFSSRGVALRSEKSSGSRGNRATTQP